MDECKLCSEAKDVEELIEVQDSLIRLKTGIISFSEAISKVFCIPKVNKDLKIRPLNLIFSTFDHL
jgi:hypothetical protein